MRVINPLAMIGIALATGVVVAILSPLAVEPFDTRPADVILKEAYATAKSENKRVFVILTATWCQPCRVFWDRINQDPWRTMLWKNYVMVRLRPLERDGDEHLGNEGAARLMKKWTGHTRVGIPYYLVLDEKGAQLANCEKVEYGSASPRVGVFAQDGEHLIEVLKKTGRHFTDSDRGRLQKWIDSQ